MSLASPRDKGCFHGAGAEPGDPKAQGKARISGLHSRLPQGVRPRLEGKQRTPLSFRVATGTSWSPLCGLKAGEPGVSGDCWGSQEGCQGTFTFHFPALEKEMATHSSILAWEIPWTEEPGGLQSMGLQRVGHH